MKKNLKLATLFVAAAISVAVVSCKKSNETVETLPAKSSGNEFKELLNRIHTFQELCDNVNSGVKSGEVVTLEQLRDDIDLTFNYEHSQHATPCANATLDTFYVRMPQVDANGNVSAADAVATYNAFETELERLMESVEDDSNLTKNFSVRFPEAGEKSGDNIEVVFTRGVEEDPSAATNPFEEGDDYIWGLLLGYCDPNPSARDTDASDELTRKYRFAPDEEHSGMFGLIYDVEYVGYKSYPDPQNYYHKHIYYNDTTLTCGHNWLFYFIGDCSVDPCIMYDEMNCYWRSNERLFVSPDGALHWGLYSGSPYHECIIEDGVHQLNDDCCIKLHLAYVTYAKIDWGYE